MCNTKNHLKFVIYHFHSLPYSTGIISYSKKQNTTQGFLKNNRMITTCFRLHFSDSSASHHNEQVKSATRKHSNISNYSMKCNATKTFKTKLEESEKDVIHPKGQKIPFLFKLSLHNPTGCICRAPFV